jgi:site-specific DNA-methyltransferase (adenine-specific)
MATIADTRVAAIMHSTSPEARKRPVAAPKPYYEQDGIVIYHGDCREILPTIGPVDLVLTDPPYGISLNPDNTRFSGGSSASKAKRGAGIKSLSTPRIIADDAEFDPSFLLDYGKHQVIWGWNNYPDKLPRGAALVWLKRNDEAFGTFLSDAELAWMSKGHGVYCKRSYPQALAHDRQHPTQKPLDLMKWCLSFFPNAQTILDPFVGSGTTLRAAKDLGRKAIGIEIDERNCEIAAKRLQQAVLPLGG